MTRPDESPQRFYGELASWWPLISPVEHYAEEMDHVRGLLTAGGDRVHRLLELGSGGGHGAAHLTGHFDMTLVDLSDDMLQVSRALNPTCEHVRGDMRSARLGREFDAVLVHDAIGYMASRDDLSSALVTAFAHCRPGGIAIFLPDDTAETFVEGTEHGGSDSPEGRGVRYLEWSWDPDPDDESALAEYAFLLREADGAVRTVHETHTFGLFARSTWLGLLEDAGFRAEIVEETTSEERAPRDIFVARRPS